VVDEQVLLAKVTAVRAHLDRVRQRLPQDEGRFSSDMDVQDVVLHNLWLAIQGCIDIAAHIVTDEGLGQPSSMAALFDLLHAQSILDANLADRLRRATGLRNLIVHEYVRLDLSLVFQIARDDLGDLESFLAVALHHAGLLP